MKHTKGEWVVDITKASIKYNPNYHCIMSGDNLVALTPISWVQLVEYEANAKLIAAAPDLLEALIEARSDLFYQIESKHGAKAAKNYPSIIKADKAIEKATK